MTEQAIQAKIIKFLEKRGAYVVKVITANKRGVPDIICCYRGVFLGIEVKRPETKKNVSKLQEHNLAKIVEAEGFSCVAWSTDEVDDILDEIDKI